MAEPGNGRITLQVGERRFYTTKDTLTCDSEYFKARFNRWNDSDADGSYFIDGDPTLFEVILQYLRTGRPPLFFDSTTQTHDLAKCAALLCEARYFQIHKLEAWIMEKNYLHIIQVNTSYRVLDETAFRTASSHSPGDPFSTTKVDFFPTSGTRKEVVCPQQSLDIRGRHRCSEYCLEQKGPLACTFEGHVPYFKILAIERTTMFNPEML
ncbi:BTB/POZ protein [Trichoderma barbatum]